MKKFYALFSTVIIIAATYGQVSFQKTYGGSGDDALFELKKTPAGYAMAGFTNSFGAGSYDFYLVKTDEIGNVQWSKTYGSTGSDECYGMLQGLDGGYVMAGYTTSFGSLGTDVFIVKTNIDGTLQWSKMVSGFSNDFVITVTGDSGYVVVGTTFSYGSGNSDMFLCKLDINGNLLWSKAVGSSGAEWGFNCRETSDGGVIATGITNSFGAGNYDFYVVKVDANGNIQWTKTYGGANQDDGHHAEQTFDGGYIIAGYTQSFGVGGTDFLLLKTDAAGNLQWSKTYGGANNDYAISVEPALNGGYVISGYSESFGFGSSDVYAIKTDSIGNVEWSHTYGGTGTEYSNKLITTADGGYALASRTASFGAGATDFYFIKTDFNGNTGCNENISTATISQTPSTIVSSGGSIVNASPTISSPSPTETSPATVTNVLCQNIPAGLFCANSIQLNPCIYNDTIIGPEKWFYFIPDSSNVEITLTNLTPNINHVHDMILSAGICNIEQYPIANSSLETPNSIITIKAMDLIIGIPHFIQLSRNQLNCPLCSAGFANYNLCIQNLPIPIITTDTNGIVYMEGIPFHVKNEVTIRFNKSHLKMNTVDDTSKIEMPIPVFIQPQMIQKMAVQIYNGDVIGLGQLKLKKVFPQLTSLDSFSISRLGDTIRIPNFWETFILTIPDTMSVLKTSRGLNRINGIRYAEPNYVAKLLDVPNDPLYAIDQGSLHPTVNYPNGHINAEPAWDIEKGKSFIRIGVYDSGIDQNHSELQNHVGGGYDYLKDANLSSPYDEQGHGSGCAGIIGASRNNNLGVAGIAGGDGTANSGITLFNMRIFSFSNLASAALISKAITQGATSTNAGGFGLHVMNNSWGMNLSMAGISSSHINLTKEAIQYAVKNGVVYVVSRGNDGNTNAQYPACFDDQLILNTGASGTNGQYKDLSNGDQYSSSYGGNLDFIAPGTTELITTTKTTTNDFRTFNGTSAAAPHVCGVAGLMLSHVNQPNPASSNLCIEDVENILQITATDKNSVGYDEYTGWGLINAGYALYEVQKPAHKVQHFGVAQNTTSYSISPSLHAKDIKVILQSNFQGFPAGTYFVDRYLVTITLNYNLNSPTDQIISSWPRYSSTLGWSGANPVNPENWCYIVSVSNTQAVLRTFIYNFKYAANGDLITDPWFPSDQFNAKAALSILTFDPFAVGIDATKNNNNLLSNPFPNPANNNTTINIFLPTTQKISLKLFDIHGKLIEHIVNGIQSQGSHKYEINLTDLSQGIYFFQLDTGNEIVQKKMAVIK